MTSRATGRDADASQDAEPSIKRHVPLTLWIVLLGGIGLSLALGEAIAILEQRNAQIRFDQDAATVHDAIKRRIELHLNLLQSLNGLFSASEQVSRAAFHRYIQTVSVGENYPAIRALQFARRVPHARKAAFEAAVRADRSLVPTGYPDYAIKPSGDREEYVAVEFNEPMNGNEAAFGHDQAYEAKRREVLERARDSGQPRASARISLVQDNRPAAAFVIRVPLYHGGGVPSTVEQRRAAYLGQLTAVVRIEDLVRTTVPPSTASNLSIALRDLGWAGESRDASENGAETLYEQAPVASAATSASFRAAFPIPIAGRHWELELARPQPEFRFSPGAISAVLVGILLTVMVRAILHELLRRRARAFALARRMTAELEMSNARLRSVVESAADTIFILDSKGQIEECNPAGLRMFGLSANGLIGQAITTVMPGLASISLEALCEQTAAAGGRELEAVRGDGSHFPAAVTLSAMLAGGERRYTAIVRDITEHHALQERMRHQAHHDVLTGLPNRTLLQERMERGLAQAQRDGTMLAVMFIDVDRFKAINDTLGHNAGDELLREIANRFKDTLRGADTVARTGGDEFVVLLTDVREEKDCAAVAENLRGAVSRAVRVGELELMVTLSIGIALFPRDGDNLELIIQRADAAMYRVKQQGRNGYGFFAGGRIELAAAHGQLRPR